MMQAAIRSVFIFISPLLFVFCTIVGGFLRVFSFDKSLQVGQAGLPEDAILFQPGIDSFQRFRIELVKAVATFASFLHQMSATKQAQMFGDGRPRNWKSLGNLSRRLSSAPEEDQARLVWSDRPRLEKSLPWNM